MVYFQASVFALVGSFSFLAVVALKWPIPCSTALKAYQSGGRRARSGVSRVERCTSSSTQRGLAGVQEHAAGSRRASPEEHEQRRRASPDVRAWRWGSTSTRSGGNHTSSETQARRDRGGLLYAGNRARKKSWLLWSPMQSSPSISLQARTIQGHSVHVLWFALVCADFIEGLDVCALDTDPCPLSYCALIAQGAGLVTGLSCLWPLTPHYLLTPVPQVWRAQWQTFRR